MCCMCEGDGVCRCVRSGWCGFWGFVRKLYVCRAVVGMCIGIVLCMEGLWVCVGESYACVMGWVCSAVGEVVREL